MNRIMNKFITLNNSVQIPVIGLGVFKNPAGILTEESVSHALHVGYRHIDTASVYLNEESVGKSVRTSGIDRSEIFVTTKLWNADHGFDKTLKALDNSLELLGLDYVDLYLMHWPVAEKRLETWKAMETLLGEGKTKAIGVSNFMLNHLEELLANCSIVPAVNQIEMTPYNYQYLKNVVDLCQQHNIIIEAYSPLTKGQKLNDPKLKSIAGIYNKSTAQLLIRWGLQKGFVVLPKSADNLRIEENAGVFDFEISNNDMNFLDDLNENLITGWDPTKQK